MAKLTGIGIYKLLPKTNCGDCNFPTCMAFAMQVATKKAALDQCPHVSEEAQTALGEAQTPPMWSVKIGTGEQQFVTGGETVLFRHEEKFYNPTGIAIKVAASLSPEELDKRVEKINRLHFVRVGEEIGVNLIALDDDGSDGIQYAKAAARVRKKSDLPLVLLSSDPQVLSPALEAVADGRPLVWAATQENWEAMANLAGKFKVPLGVRAETLEGLAELTGKIKEKGVEDLVIEPPGVDLLDNLTKLTKLRRLALEKVFRPLGYPMLVLTDSTSPAEEASEAVAYICRYAGIVVINGTESWEILPLLTTRQKALRHRRTGARCAGPLYDQLRPYLLHRCRRGGEQQSPDLHLCSRYGGAGSFKRLRRRQADRREGDQDGSRARGDGEGQSQQADYPWVSRCAANGNSGGLRLGGDRRS